MTHRLFYDFEFWEDGPDKPIVPISLGMVTENLQAFYAEFTFDWSICNNQWLHDHVRPHLGTRGQFPRLTIRNQLLEWLNGNVPELYGYFADYDHVCLSQLFGRMIDLPKGWPMYTLDLKQYARHIDAPDELKPPEPKDEHNALADAMWNREYWLNLREYEIERGMIRYAGV